VAAAEPDFESVGETRTRSKSPSRRTAGLHVDVDAVFRNIAVGSPGPEKKSRTRDLITGFEYPGLDRRQVTRKCSSRTE
jgi:hypothetical protein